MKPPTDFLYDVYLSYNHHDQSRVRRLAERLRDAGLRVWFDEWIVKPGDDIFLAVERGLETSRTLILCLSPAALDSDWVRLERNTVLFRDPSNAGRRFIPLLLKDCNLPDTLRRYKYLDFRQENEAALQELCTACRREEKPTISDPPSKAREKVKPVKKPEHPDPMAIHEKTLTEHRDWVWSLAFTPDNMRLFSGSTGEIKVWEVEDWSCRFTIKGHPGIIRSLSITPDGKYLLSTSQYGKSLKVWDIASSGEMAKWTQDLGTALSVAVLPDGNRALGGSGEVQALILWELKTGQRLRSYTGHSVGVYSVSVSKDGRYAISGDVSGFIRLWDIETGKCLAVLIGHNSIVYSLLFTNDGKFAISSSEDKTIKVWDLKTGACLGTLEGHQTEVYSIAISPYGNLLASAGYGDHILRVWDWQSGTCLQIIEFDEYPISVAFCPDGSSLAVGTTKGSIYIFRLANLPVGLPVEPARRYINAKVVLVGESGVGKSGLAHRLVEDEFVPTPSTHGMQVWRLDLPKSPTNELPIHSSAAISTSSVTENQETAASSEIEREALLWDLAGQEDYRLIHQLFLDETALALVLINPQKDDPFAEVGDWLKALQAALASKGPNREAARLLIAARSDVGGVKISRQKIDRFLQEHGFAGYLAASALTGENCSDKLCGGHPSGLKRLIADSIPWDQQPWTSTPRLLADLKNLMIELREQKEIRLLRFAELYQRLEQMLTSQKFEETDLRTAITLLSNHGLVMPLKFGDLVLMRPELLNGYAAAIIRQARKHLDEIGCVREQDIFDREIDLEGVDRLNPADEDLLMRALVQTLLDKSLCIAEDTSQGRHLVFPSQYRRERPLPTHPEIFVSYTFTGELQTVYTTLVVRLWYSREFDHKELWHYAAEFLTSKKQTLGLLMEKTGDGQGTISVFFDSGVPDELKVVFIEYIHRHLERYARDVFRDRRYICKNCSTPVRDLELVRKRIAAQKDFITCQNCDEKVPLQDHIEQRLGTDPVARKILAMEQTGQRELDTQALEQILIGHLMAICGEANQIFRSFPHPENGIDGEVEFKDNSGRSSGRKIYVQVKHDDSYLVAKQTEDQEIFNIKNPRHLEYWITQPIDVYLVIRDAQERIRWMNLTRYLKTRQDKSSRHIIFQGEKLDAPAVWRARDDFFKR